MCKTHKALITDASAIQGLVNNFAKHGGMIMLSKNDVYERIFEYLLYKEDGKLLGVCALHPTWEDIAEIRSLAVDSSMQGKGIGKILVQAQLERAKECGFSRVFTLTYQVEFFSKLGFKVVSMDELPKKSWTDCLKCIKYPECDETAMIIELN